MNRLLSVLILGLAGLAPLAIFGAPSSPVPGAGIHSWAGWRPGQISPQECPELRGVPIILKWHSLEPKPGKYEFEKYLGKPLRAAVADDLHVTVMIWVGPAVPEWIYDVGVPLVKTDRTVNALGQPTTSQSEYPYYFSPEYKSRFFGLIDALSAYVKALPAEMRDRIAFIQSAEGSTGDGDPYKGNPLDPQYEISHAKWNDFRQETWIRYMAGSSGIPILVNSDANKVEQRDWLLDNMEVIALKNGMFSHGFHVSDNRERLEQFRKTSALAHARGKPMLSRGEMDKELFVMGWSKRNVAQALYWSGLFATHCGLDIWNVPHDALRDEANLPALVFFNKYAGHRDPATAPGAFSALRDGLDAADFDRFSMEAYGGNSGKKNSPERYLKIAEKFATYGARMDDPAKALKGGMVNRKRSGSNDVGWGILPSNYERFLAQMDTGNGDVGHWNIDDSIYGRFGRGFEHASGKTRLKFKLDDAFFANAGKPREVVLRIVCKDEGSGSWFVNYAGPAGMTQTVKVQNTNSGEWKTHRVVLTGATFNGALRGADLSLEYGHGDDTIFHLVELLRIP